MRKYLLLGGLILTLLAMTNQSASAAPACTAQFSVIIRDGFGNLIPNASFSLYEEGVDANGVRKPVKQVAVGRIDPVLGYGQVKFNTTTTTTDYIIKVTNPNVKNRDFLFYDLVTANCGYQGKAELTLSLLRVTVQDTLSNILKNAPVSLGAQGVDSLNKTVSVENLGNFNTGDLGRVDIFLPVGSKSAVINQNYYLIGAKNAKGLTFYQQDVQPIDNTVGYVSITLSDAVITVKDGRTGAVTPNFKVTVYNQAVSVFGGYAPDKQIANLTTDDQGRAYIQLPAGNYYLSYANANGERINTVIQIAAGKRHDFLVWLENQPASKCQYKSDFKLVLKDYQQQIIGNANFTLFNQTFDPDGLPTPDAKAISGAIDDYGLSSVKFVTTPTQKYLLQVCANKTNDGCFWYPNIIFDCSDRITLEKTIPATTIILRDNLNQLMTGQKFKIYQQIKDVDGRVIIDKDLLIGAFTLRPPGKLTLYLPAKDLRNFDQSYIIAIDQKNQQIAKANFTVPDGNQTLDYVVGAGQMKLVNSAPVKKSVASPVGLAPAHLLGRIVLQVQSKGEAWYISSKTGLRYFLGSAGEAYQVMKKVSTGMLNKDLAKIEPVVDGVTGVDTDGDGLPDRLEIALGTNPNQADSDHDGYDDYQEAIGGFNPMGPGRMGFNQTFARQYAGRILLQAEGRGEAWYVNPLNLKRYYLGAPADALALMRKLGLGITNADLAKIRIGN